VLRQVRRAVRDRLARRLDVPEIPTAPERLKVNNYNPENILDVGAAYSGDFARLCRSQAPSAHLTCFEVLANRVSDLRRWCSQDGNGVVVE
jgi:hypothetical protein